MASIADSIRRITVKALNGELLRRAKNGEAIPAKNGIGLGGSEADPVSKLGDEVFNEYERSTAVTNVYSTDDPDLYVEVTQPIKIKLKSDAGRKIELNLKEPVQEAP